MRLSNIVKAGSSQDEALQQIAEKKSLTRGKGGNSNFPNAAHDEKPADTSMILSQVINWYKMPKAETDDEIAERLEMYFDRCIETGERPLIENIALALGYSRVMLHMWKNEQYGSKRRSEMIKRAYEVVAAYDAAMVSGGKMNPVPYIFRAKNYYGMRDQTDLVVTPNNPLGDTISAEEIEEKYNYIPEE